MLGPLAGRPVVQLGLVVSDLEAAIAVLGGDWLRPGPAPEGFYRDVTGGGRELVLDHRVALRKGEHPQVELIEPGEGPNIWNDWLAAGGPWLHHLGVVSESPLAEVPAMEAAGHACLMSGRFGEGGEFAYFDTAATIGVHVEALRLPAGLRGRR